jgi:outer membrane murein-binding lipoprotein Lpp
MRITHIILTIGALALSLTMMAGMVHTPQFQQAAAVETSGFDALAHDLFAHGALGAPSKAGPGAHGE